MLSINIRFEHCKAEKINRTTEQTVNDVRQYIQYRIHNAELNMLDELGASKYAVKVSSAKIYCN